MERGQNPADWDKPAQDGPGKFEGECEFTLHYWGLILDGDTGDRDFTSDGPCPSSETFFRLEASDAYDAAIMADNPDAYGVQISEDSNGFVSGSIMVRVAYEKAVRDAEEYYNGSEGGAS